MKDIETYDDCLQLVQAFYNKLLSDDRIGHFFQALDLTSHIPRVAHFWAFILIDQPGYTNNMMAAHAGLKLSEGDFERWLMLFHSTVNEMFHGEKADLAIERSRLIAWTMRSKI